MLRAFFWLTAGTLAYAQAGYAAALLLLDRGSGAPDAVPSTPDGELPAVALIVAAYNEEAVIGQRISNARTLDYPADRLEVIVADDGSSDDTALVAIAAGADRVLELPRGGKVRAQDAGVDATSAPVLAFSDANAEWEPDALRRLVASLDDPAVGYACGQVRFVNPAGGTNQEGLYWRYEMAIRALESRLASVTAGNGAIYAVRREAYLRVDPVMGHDLSFPSLMVKRGWRAVYAPDAVATEKMVPTIEGEWRRKRRMMSHAWPIVLRGGLLDPRGYPPLYALMIASHRLLRYAAPALHVAIVLSALAGRDRAVQRAALAAHAALLAAARRAGVRLRPLLLARYYVLTTASLAAGLYDHLRHGTPAGWDAPEGTR